MTAVSVRFLLASHCCARGRADERLDRSAAEIYVRSLRQVRRRLEESQRKDARNLRIRL